ncbi:MAG: hypothetical protein ACOYIQ_02830 [Christensenellales bacterium]|jgi:hypothetical protein
MLKFLKRIFKRKDKSLISEERTDSVAMLKRPPISERVNVLIKNADEDVKGPY